MALGSALRSLVSVFRAKNYASGNSNLHMHIVYTTNETSHQPIFHRVQAVATGHQGIKDQAASHQRSQLPFSR